MTMWFYIDYLHSTSIITLINCINDRVDGISAEVPKKLDQYLQENF